MIPVIPVTSGADGAAVADGRKAKQLAEDAKDMVGHVADRVKDVFKK